MKTKTARIELRVTPKDKTQIEKNAKMCGLSVNEYVTKRAIGYQPNAVDVEALFTFNQKISDFLNQDISPKLEEKALELFDEILDNYLVTHKQTVKEIRKEMVVLQAQDSGQ